MFPENTYSRREGMIIDLRKVAYLDNVSIYIYVSQAWTAVSTFVGTRQLVMVSSYTRGTVIV